MTKNRILSILTLLLFFVANTQAQSLKELILKMPSEVCPILTEYNKLELVDNQKNGKPMQTRNIWKAVSELKTLDDNYAYLKSTKNSEKVFKLLPTANGEKIIAVVSTIYVDDKPDSSIEFYNTAWQKLDASEHFDDAISSRFRHIELSKDNNSMNIIYGNPLAISIDGSTAPASAKTTKETKNWNGNKFE